MMMVRRTENKRGGGWDRAQKMTGKCNQLDHVLHLIIISALDLVFPFHLVNFLSFILVSTPPAPQDIG